MNWHTGQMTIPHQSAAGSRWRLTSAGDWAPKSDWGTERSLEAAMINRPLDVYGDVLPHLLHSELNIVNVETVLGTVGEPLAAKGGNALPLHYYLRGDEHAVAMLKAIPFQVACLANNHILDFGKEGLARTIDVLQRAGMKTVGAGITDELAAEPLLVDVKGVPLAIINCAEGEQCRSSNGGPGANGFELHRISEQIRALKASGAVVIVVYHGGREYIPVPPVYVVRQLRELANQGADAVIAHHPHVPQGMELYRGVPIVYSQGNFLFWMRSPLFYRRAGYLVHLDFCGSTLVGLEITPYYQEETGIRLMGPRMRHQFAADMDAVSDLLTTPGAIELAWDAIADAEADHFPKVLEQAAEGIRKNKRAMTARTGNMFATPAWRELWIHLSQRLITDQVGTSPEWARQWLQLWSSYTAAEAEALDNCSSKERGD